MTDNIYPVLWEPGTPIADLSAERVKEIQGRYTGPLVAVVVDGGVAIIQPMDPNTGEDWESEEKAMAFAYRYMGLNEDGTPKTPEQLAAEKAASEANNQ